MDRRRAAGALLALAACIACSAAAPTASNHTALDLYEGPMEGCYYNFQRYGEGDRIMTNEPCLNCTCHNHMLMCYLRVCPFTKPIGQDCTVEKRADQCCPIVTCPDVPVDLLTSTSTSSPAEYGGTGVGKLDKYGCSINGKYLPEGSKVPPTPNKPCEHCYCIRNMTTCVMQECTLHVDGCTPIYHKDVCCPVRYSCDHPEDEIPLLDDMTTTVRPTPGFLLTTTTLSPVTQTTQDCVHDDQIFPDGALIKTEKACEHCYCMKGDIVCVVQECGTPMENEGKNCTSLPPREGQCCPDTYICEGDELPADLSTQQPTESFETTSQLEEQITTLTPPRRVSIEGSGYRNEPDMPSYTEIPTFDSEIEGSGEEQKTETPIVSETSVPEKETPIEDISTSTETHRYTTESKLGSEKTTTEPDKGLNTVPIGTSEDEFVEPSVPETTRPSENVLTTEPIIIIGEQQTVEDKIITTVADYQPSSVSDTSISREDEFIITTEPTFRKEDEGSVPTVQTLFTEPTIAFKDEVTSKFEQSATPSVATTKLPKYTDEVKETVPYKESSTESYLIHPTFEPASTHEQEVISESVTTTINPILNEIDDETSHPGRIPGEGDCLLNGITYKNNSSVPNTNNCHSSCKCISSIVKCDPIICSPPPEYMDNCQPMYDTPESCCPTYICDHAQETIPPQPHSQMSGTESPLSTPSFECAGDQCQVTQEKEVPSVTPEKCSPTDNCLTQSSEKPEITGCGPHGCDEIQTPGYPVEVQPEKCTGPECVPSSESCAEGNCQYPPSSDKCEGEGGCEVSPVKPCVGEDCIKQEIEPSKNIPQLCENEKECQGAESSEAQHPHCEGESCLEDKIDCKDNKCISHQLPTQTTEGEKICTDESNCRLPIEEGISEECTEDSCRRKQIAESETTLPSACSSNECLQEKPISSTEKPTDIDILSTASPFVEKLTTVISDTSVSEHFTEPETLGTKKPEKIEHEESEFSTTETIDLVTKKPFSTSDSITTEVHPEIPGFEPSVSEQPVVKLSTAPEPEYEHSTDKQLQSETPKLEETVTGIPDSSKPEYIEPELDRSTSESPASEQSEYDKYPTSEQYERETVSPDKMEHEVTKEPSSEQTESDITVTKQPKPEISASEKTKLVIPTTEIIETESSASETPPSEQYDSKIPELEVSTVKQTELEALVTEKAEPEVPFTLQTEFETQTVKATEVTTSELLETSTQAKLEEDEFVPVQVEPGTLAPEISASEKPKITVTLQPEIETTSERLESELPVSVHPVTEISKHPDIQTSSSESYGTQQPELVTEKSETTVAEQHIRETTVSEHKQETSTSKYSETESYTEATPASKQHELELHTEAIPASEQPQPEISTLEEHQSQPPKSEQFESTTATLEQFELETPVTDQPLPESSGPEQTKPEISVPKQPVSEIPAPEDAKPNILTTEQYEIQTVRPERVESDSSTIKQVELESSTTPEQAQSGTTVPEQLELETQAPEYAKPETLAPVEYESRAPSSEQTGTEAPEPERTEPATILPERIEPQTLAPELLTTEQPEHAHEIDQHKQFEESDTGLPEASTGPAKQDVTLIEPGKQTTELFEKTTEQQLYFESSVTDKTMPSVTDKDLTKLPVTAYIGSQEITTKLSIESATSLPDVTESKGITGHHEVSVEESSEAVTKAVEIPTTPVIEQDHTEGLQVTEAQEIRTTISEEFNLEITTKSPEHVYPGKETATEYPQYHATKSEAQPDKETGSPVLPVTESKVPDAVTPVEEGITTKLPEEIIKEQEISTQNAVTIPSVETTTLTEEVEKTITEQEKGPEIKATEHSITEVPAFDVEVPERGTTKVPEETLTDQTLETKAPEEISEISTVTTDMHKKFSTELPMSHVSIFVESVTKPEEQGEIRTELPIKPEEINTSTPEISVSVEETKTEHPQHITTQEYVTKAPESIVTKEKEIHTESSITEFEKPSTTVQYDEIRTEPTKSSDIVIHDFVTKTSESPEEEKKTTEIPDLSVKPQESTSIVPEHIDEQESSTVSLQKYSPEEEEQRTELPSTLEPEQKHSEYITTGIKETSTVPSISEELKTEQTKTPILLHTEGVEPPATSETETITKSPIAGTSVSTVKEEIGTATLKTTETETSKPYVTGQEEKTTISAFTEQEIRTDQEPSVTESYTKVSGEEVFQTKVPENIVTEVQSITTIISDTSGTEKYGVTVEAPKISSTTSLSDTATELPGTFVTKEESQTETYLITHHDISTELPEILTQEKITTRTPDVEFSTQGPEIFTIGDQEKEPHAITTERSEEYVTRVQEKTSANIPEDQKTQPQQITAVTPELSVYEIPEISTKVPETGLSDVQESYTHEEEKITEIPVAFITEQTLTTKIAEFSTEEQKKYTKQPEVMSHVTEPQEESTEKEELITKLPDMYLTTSRTEVTESSKTPESFTKQEEIQTVSSEETSTKIPELYVTEAHKVATEFSETPDIKQDTITKLPVEIGSQQPVTQLDVVEPDLETSTKTEEAYEEKQTEATSPRLPELSTVSQEELTQEHGIVTKSPERETIAPELETDITDQRPSTELPESFTKLPEEPESTSEHIHESSETTPYLVELEEHTHKIEEEIGTTLSTEMISTKYPKLPAVQDKLPEATDKTDTEKQTKMPAKEDDIEKTSTPIEGVFTTDLYHTSSSSSTESSALSEETTKQQIDRETTPSVSAHEDKETKVSTAPTETPFIQDTQVSIQPEKETETSTEKIFETTSSEKEIKPSTTEVTTSKAEEVSTQASPVYDKYTKPVSETLPSTMKPEIPKPGLNEIQPTDDIPLPEDEGHFPTSGTGGYGQEPDYVEEDQAFGPGTCRYGGKVYVSAQQIPRDDPCDFCFCFRSDIICLQQSCPPPIHGCHEEPIQGFCCPRYECPVSMATTLNVTTTTTTTTTTLPPHFLPHAYKGAAQRKGCLIKGHTYKVGEVVRSSSGPCLHCTCGGDGQMKCDPKACTPEPMLRQMIAAAVSAKRRR